MLNMEVLMKNKLHDFKKGYYRPISMPIWKWIIILLVWTVSVLCYCLALVISMWLLVGGILFQMLAFCLMTFLDTGNWRNSDDGKNYLKRYYPDLKEENE